MEFPRTSAAAAAAAGEPTPPVAKPVFVRAGQGLRLRETERGVAARSSVELSRQGQVGVAMANWCARRLLPGTPRTTCSACRRPSCSSASNGARPSAGCWRTPSATRATWCAAARPRRWLLRPVSGCRLWRRTRRHSAGTPWHTRRCGRRWLTPGRYVLLYIIRAAF